MSNSSTSENHETASANLNIVSSSSASSVDERSAGSSSPKAAATEVPTAITAPSPVTTKAKSLTTKTPTSSKGKPLTVTVNGNDRSKDLNEHDVVCEKGRGDHERWPGNKLYRHLINVHKETYNDLAPIERSNIIGKIIGTIQEKDGWFVSHSEATGNWAKLTEEKVRKKVSDDLRREVRRRREKRSHNSVFSAKLRAIKELEEVEAASRDIIERVDDPRQNDVLFGPGARRHPGNKVYWHHMKLNLEQYIISPYGARSVISRNIVQVIRNQHGRFLEQDPKSGLWYSISDKRALEKTSHALSNMKYKTRKRHPEEPSFPPPHAMYTPVPHGFVPSPYGLHPHHPMAHHPHHPMHPHNPHHPHMVAAYRAYSDETMGMYGGDDSDLYDPPDTKILEGDSPNTIFAKKRTKKFRLLNRMDDIPGSVSVEQTPLKGKDSNTKLPKETTPKPLAVLDAPITTPGLKTLASVTAGPAASAGKIISPNSASDEYQQQEQRNPNAYHHHRTMGHHPLPAAEDAYRGGDIAPRLSQFDPYTRASGANSGSKQPLPSSSYASSMREDYTRRYHLAPSLVAAAAASTSEAVARRWATGGVPAPTPEYY